MSSQDITTEKKDKTVKMNFKLILISFIFLFNANINVIDVFPDIIGYLILFFALVRLSDLNEDIADAYKFFRYMLIVEAAKILSILWVFGLSQRDEQNTGTLLIAFVFSVLDVIILFNAFNKLFSGLISLGYKHPNTSVLAGKKANGRSYTEKMRSFTLFFIVFRAAMSVLPEFSNLASYGYDESSRTINLYEYIGLMRGMSFVLVTVVGVVWLVKIIRYFFRINKDTEFCSSLSNAYACEILPKKSLFIRRNLAAVFFLFVAASVFMIDFRVEYFNLIPDFVGALLFTLGFFISVKNVTLKKTWVRIIPVIYVLTSVLAYVSEIIFFDKYYYGAIYRNAEAYKAYCVMCAFSVLNILVFAFTSVLLICCLRNVIINHTGFVYGTDAQKDSERIAAYHRESQRKLIFLTVTSVIMIAADIFYTFFAVKYGFAGAISVLASILFFVSVLKVTQDISEDIETKYMLD